MKNLILIGMPGSGKSTFGRRLADALSRPFIDCDALIEEMEGRTIPELFRESEDTFRAAETRACAALSLREGLIIAAGGGVVTRRENISLFRRSGRILFIDRSPDDIAGDVAIAGRPLLAEGPAKVYTLYKERIALYRAAADVTLVNDGSEDAMLAALLRAAKEMENEADK